MSYSFPTFKQIITLPYEEIVDTWPEIFKPANSSTLSLESVTHVEENSSQPSLTNQQYSGLSESEYYEQQYENYIQDRFCRYGY